MTALLAVVAPRIPAWYWQVRSDNPVRRGARLAAANGCLSCHAAASGQAANPGSRWGSVPSFSGGNLIMYVHGPDDVARWIRDGSPARAEGAPAPFAMPAFGRSLSSRAVAELSAFVLASDGLLTPVDGAIARGREIARRFACESCHGPGGAGGVKNTRSFTGSVAGWIGPEFTDLVHDPAEFEEWIRRGESRRLARNPVAAHFLNAGALKMPAFGAFLTDDDVGALWSYVQWLRQSVAGSVRAP